MKKALTGFYIFLLFICSPAFLKPEHKILCLSDLHFDPYYDTTIIRELINEPYQNWSSVFDSRGNRSLGTYGKDANYPLLKSLMNELSGKMNEFDLVIISGDFLSHNFNRDFHHYSGTDSNDSLHLFIEKTIYFIRSMFDNYLPGKPVIPALGNNDSYCGDYMLEPEGEFLKMFFRCWAERIPERISLDRASEGGYYDLYYPLNSRNRFIILNTVFFSENYFNKCGNESYDPGMDQMIWLEKILSESKLKGDNVWLIYHIAPGVDVFSTLVKDTVCKDKIVTLWKEKYTERFFDIIYEYKENIKAQIAGHIHRDDFRVLTRSDVPISFIHLNPAVSPIYGNNPSYQLLTVNYSGFSLLNAETFYINITQNDPSWITEYNFNNAYGENGINSRTLMNVSDKIFINPEIRLKYFNYYTSFMDKGISKLEKEWLAYWCGITKMNVREFENCYCR